MFEHVVRFVITLLIPTAEEADVTGMLRDLASAAGRRRASQLLDQPGNSLVFVHGKLTSSPYNTACHPERSEAKSKDPAELPDGFRHGILRLRSASLHSAQNDSRI